MRKALIGGGAAALLVAVAVAAWSVGMREPSMPPASSGEAPGGQQVAAESPEGEQGAESWDAPMGVELGGSVYGNAPGNTAQGGYSLFYDDWIYYTSMPEYSALYRMRPDGSEKQPMGDSAYSHLSMYDGWLYYVSMNGPIVKMRPDGSGREQMTEFGTCYLNIVDGWMYFTRSERGVGNYSGEIWRMRPDGSGLEMLHEGSAQKLAVYGGWIYFAEPRSDEDPGRKAFFRMSLEGGEVQLVNESVHEYVLAGDWVFYRGLSEDGLFKMRLDGSEMQKVSEFDPVDICSLGDWVYYVERVDASTRPLWRYNVMTSEASLVSDMACFGVDAIGDRILVQEWPGEQKLSAVPINNRLYVADPDGSNMLLVDERFD